MRTLSYEWIMVLGVASCGWLASECICKLVVAVGLAAVEPNRPLFEEQ